MPGSSDSSIPLDPALVGRSRCTRSSGGSPLVVVGAGVNSRVHLTAEDRSILVRLVVVHRMEYSLKKGAKAPLWNKIRILLNLEIDKDLKHPDHAIKQMSDERRVPVQQERKESGNVQLNSEMDQNLDWWIEREDEFLKEKQDAKKPMDALEREAAHATVHRDNLLLSRSNKCMYVSEDDFDSDDTEDALLPETRVRRGDSAAGSSQPVYLREGVEDDERDSLNVVSRIRRMRKRVRNQDRSKEESVKEERIVSALGNVGALMAGTWENLRLQIQLQTARKRICVRIV